MNPAVRGRIAIPSEDGTKSPASHAHVVGERPCIGTPCISPPEEAGEHHPRGARVVDLEPLADPIAHRASGSRMISVITRSPAWRSVDRRARASPRARSSSACVRTAPHRRLHPHRLDEGRHVHRDLMPSPGRIRAHDVRSPRARPRPSTDPAESPGRAPVTVALRRAQKGHPLSRCGAFHETVIVVVQPWLEIDGGEHHGGTVAAQATKAVAEPQPHQALPHTHMRITPSPTHPSPNHTGRIVQVRCDVRDTFVGWKANTAGKA